ncbi:adenosylcobalamin-dependent ribonucleoside-diphosphate reductase [Candidatus Woesearchaeota archaeon]|nr:adenosylcobalamin-dependent ribonucleoside-diphosphate reductase [Candidatus Woesearchaeota archaeon]
MPIIKIRKRDGRLVDFDKQRIAEAIFKAAYSVGGRDRKRADELAEKVIESVNEKFKNIIPTVEQVQDIVERVLIEKEHIKTAKAFILYREKQSRIRELKTSLIGAIVSKNLSFNALKILKERYLLKDENDNLIETPEGMFKRVAKNIAKADEKYDDFNAKETEQKFYEAMNNLDFLPNSPTLMNAGTRIQQLSACFVLPINDSIDDIYMTLRNAAIIHQSGGGTGFSFSKLRPKNDLVGSTKGVSSGPLSFIELFDKSTEIMKQGGKRRGANMGILRVDHPDILEFIGAKEDTTALNNFNISVGITEKFMDAVAKNIAYALINPRNGEVVRKLPAREILDLISTMAWKNGEPGVVFLNTMNHKNPTPDLGEIESTNPCGEVPLLPYESCNLGSINLYHCVKKSCEKKIGGELNKEDNIENKKDKNGNKCEIDFEKVKELVWLGVHFLDNVIDMNKYPLKKIEEMTKANRKIGLGIMGFADMLFCLGIKYDSKEGLETAEKIMRFIENEARKASQELAKKRGVFPNWSKSIYAKKDIKLRNATLTSIAPTGTISMIADCSSSIEPNYAISYVKKVMNGEEFLYINKQFGDVARERDVYTEELMKKISSTGTLQHFEEIPKDVRNIFVTSHDISAEYHVRMQAAFQTYVDNAVSKSVNLKYTARKEDVTNIFKLAYELGCKGITIYRDRSRDDQVLNIEYDKKEFTKRKEIENKFIKKKDIKTKNEKTGNIVKKRRIGKVCETC